MPPNLAAAGISPGLALSTARHSSWTRVHNFARDLPVSSSAPSTANPCHADLPTPEKRTNPYIFGGRTVSTRPNHGVVVTGGRNDGGAADPFTALMGPPLDALGGPHVASIRIRRAPASAPTPAGAVSDQRGTEQAPRTTCAFLSDLALTLALFAVVAGAGIVAANFAIDHPTIVRAALGSVFAIWPAWLALAVVFGVAAWRGGR